MPQEEQAGSNLTDKVAQHSKDSTASDHALHDEARGAVEEAGGPLNSKGPQVPEGDLPEAKGKDELKAKAAELNK